LPFPPRCRLASDGFPLLPLILLFVLLRRMLQGLSSHLSGSSRVVPSFRGPPPWPRLSIKMGLWRDIPADIFSDRYHPPFQFLSPFYISDALSNVPLFSALLGFPWFLRASSHFPCFVLMTLLFLRVGCGNLFAAPPFLRWCSHFPCEHAHFPPEPSCSSIAVFEGSHVAIGGS